MSQQRYFRGGPSLTPRPVDLRPNPTTGLLRPGRGVSVFSEPGGLERFGGAYEVMGVPPDLVIVQTGKNPKHYEIAPAAPMTMAEYVAALGQIVLIPTGVADDPST
ncbi:MAG: hypothetical protein MUF18_05140 [Fimbriiglobus sp.]|jgi:hypothetical protein|nr:hypothetical protein [Fimbriiglobus sp.]